MISPRRDEAAEKTPVLPASPTLILDEYLDGIDTDEQLAPKTRFDYRMNRRDGGGRARLRRSVSRAGAR